MEEFYLRNVTLYQRLLASIDPTAPAVHFSRKTASASQRQERKAVKEQCHPSITVSARIRPMSEEDCTTGFSCAVFPRKAETGKPQIADIHGLYNHPTRAPIIKSSEHTVDFVYGSDATSQALFDGLVDPLIGFAKNGGVGTLIAYGQTGSGKTYTISRLQKFAGRELMENAEHSGYKVYLTYFDLAGNSAFDLLNSRNPFSVLEDGEGNIHLSRAEEKPVSTEDELTHWFEIAMANRSTASTTKNDASSRSHSICRMRLQHGSRARPEDGLLYLVDLAGSEAARDIAEHGAERMRETKEINVSLSVLKDCIRGKAEAEALRDAGFETRSKKIRVPIRSSTLTKTLKHVLDPQGKKDCKTAVIACVNPSLADCGPSRNTLRYAELLRMTAPTAVEGGRRQPRQEVACSNKVSGPSDYEKDTGNENLGRRGGFASKTRPETSEAARLSVANSLEF